MQRGIVRLLASVAMIGCGQQDEGCDGERGCLPGIEFALSEPLSDPGRYSIAVSIDGVSSEFQRQEYRCEIDLPGGRIEDVVGSGGNAGYAAGGGAGGDSQVGSCGNMTVSPVGGDAVGSIWVIVTPIYEHARVTVGHGGGEVIATGEYDLVYVTDRYEPEEDCVVSCERAHVTLEVSPQ